MEQERLTAVETQQKVDNAVLIRLDTKFDYMAADIKELKDSVNAQISQFDNRIKALEQLRDQINPQQLVETVSTHTDFINDYKSTHKERNMIITSVFSILSMLFVVTDMILKFIFKIH